MIVHLNKHNIIKHKMSFRHKPIEKRDLRAEANRIDSEIHIYGAPNNINMTQDVQIDKLDANEAETFTLEEFRNIILEFRRNDKDCIIAKVSTPDQDRSEASYCDYYLASEINKILFKFERERRLLHRMRVRNPLNNQFIIGPVHYYKITCFEVDKAVINFFFDASNLTETNQHRKAFSEVFRTTSSSNSEEMRKEKAKDTSDLTSRDEITQSLMDESPRTLLDDVLNGKLKVPSKKRNAKLFYTACYFACDDDFLMCADVREYFRTNSLDPSEEFLFELDRTHNDLFALLDTTSDSTDEDVVGWKRVLAVHMSVLVTMLGIVILLGANPLILIIAFPCAVLTLISFLLTLLYIMVFRRDTFGSLAVRSIEDV